MVANRKTLQPARLAVHAAGLATAWLKDNGYITAGSGVFQMTQATHLIKDGTRLLDVWGELLVILAV